MKRNAANERPKGSFAVGEVAGVLPEEVPDEGFRQPLIAGVLHKKMLDLGYHSADVEDPVSDFHPLQVDGDHPETVAEKDISRSHVAVDENLIVLPHKLLPPPLFFKSVEVLGLVPSNIPPVLQLIHNPVEVGAVRIHVSPHPGGSPIMNGGKKICQCGKFLKESVPCSFPDCLDDKVVERYTVAKLLYQNTVEACIAANWAGNVMGVAGKADAAKMVKVVEFPFHVMEGALRRSICDTNEKFSNETRPADLIFIEIDVVGGLELIHPEVGGGAMDTDLRKDVIAQISIERVFSGKMSEIFHESSIGFGEASFEYEG